MEPVKPLVLGLGNLLMQDDGVGVHLVNRLKDMEIGGMAEIVDGGTAGHKLVPLLDAAPRLIVVDAVACRRRAGTIVRLTGEALARAVSAAGEEPCFGGLSLHRTGLHQVFEYLLARGVNEDVVLIGIQPLRVDWGLELTAPVAAAVPKAIKLITDQVMSWLADTPDHTDLGEPDLGEPNLVHPVSPCTPFL